jgi:glycosyltransferase involved in cell wall biosynthesis
VIGPTPPYRGGIAHFNARLLEALWERAEALAVGWSAQFPSWIDRLRPDSSTWDGTWHSQPLLNWRRPASWIQAAEAIHGFGAERVVLHWAHPFAAPMYLALIARLRRAMPGASIQFIVHNAIPHENRLIGRIVSRVVLRTADRLVAHCRADARRLQSWFPSKPVAEGFHPVYDRFSRGPVESVSELDDTGRPLLLFFGFIRAYKGLDLLLEAMPRVIEKWPDVTLLVVGEVFGSRRFRRRSDPARQVAALGLGRHVRLVTRYVRDEEVAPYFRAADLVVLPYRTATQSGVLQVAYALDRPVVATRVGGLEEAVEEGVSGRLAESGSAESLASAIGRSLADPIPAESVRKFRARFSWNSYVDLLLAQPRGGND